MMAFDLDTSQPEISRLCPAHVLVYSLTRRKPKNAVVNTALISTASKGEKQESAILVISPSFLAVSTLLGGTLFTSVLRIPLTVILKTCDSKSLTVSCNLQWYFRAAKCPNTDEWVFPVLCRCATKHLRDLSLKGSPSFIESLNWIYLRMCLV